MKEERPVQVSHVERPFGAQPLILETGKLAKQAHGAITVRYGDTIVLVAAVEGSPIPGRDFFPLTVDYREKVYAAGKFPGGFIKREGRPTTKEILTSRLIDRPIRPLFPVGYVNEVQVMASVLSADRENDPDVLCMIGSSGALHVSPIPFLQPTGSVRVGRASNEWIVMPTHSQLEESDLDLIVSGSRDAITMIEGFAREMSEEEMLQSILFAHKHIVTVIEMVEELRQGSGLGKKELPPPAPASPVKELVFLRYYEEFKQRKLTSGKQARADAIKELREKVLADLVPKDTEPEHDPAAVAAAFDALQERVVRDLILEGKRIDGRTTKQVRAIQCEVGVLPRTHGSAIFQRGETQALVTTTWAPPATSSAWTGSWTSTARSSCSTTTSRLSVSASASPSAAPAAARSATAPSPSAASRPSSPAPRNSPTRFASSATSSSRTARQAWPRSAAAPCR